MDVKQLGSKDLGVPEIIKEIDDLMSSLYPPESNHLLPLEELDSNNVYFAGVYLGHTLSACGALVQKEDDGDYGEFKRIYVNPKSRGKGLSKHILNHLIEYAILNAIPVLRLETGNKQKKAIKLYQSFGFQKRNEFGTYSHDPTSVFMELKLKDNHITKGLTGL